MMYSKQFDLNQVVRTEDEIGLEGKTVVSITEE